MPPFEPHCVPYQYCLQFYQWFLVESKNSIFFIAKHSYIEMPGKMTLIHYKHNSCSISDKFIIYHKTDSKLIKLTFAVSMNSL